MINVDIGRRLQVVKLVKLKYVLKFKRNLEKLDFVKYFNKLDIPVDNKRKLRK